jgi:hypothetical protein
MEGAPRKYKLGRGAIPDFHQGLVKRAPRNPLGGTSLLTFERILTINCVALPSMIVTPIGGPELEIWAVFDQRGRIRHPGGLGCGQGEMVAIDRVVEVRMILGVLGTGARGVSS